MKFTLTENTTLYEHLKLYYFVITQIFKNNLKSNIYIYTYPCVVRYGNGINMIISNLLNFYINSLFAQFHHLSTFSSFDVFNVLFDI